MGQVSRKLSAGQHQTIAMQGSVVYVMAASNPFQLTAGGETYEAQQGDKLTVHGGFQEVKLKDTSGSQTTVTLAITNGDFQRAQIANDVHIQSANPVPVDLAQQSLAQYPALKQGKTFVGSSGVTTSNATAFPAYFFVELFNPSGSSIQVTNPTLSASLSAPNSGSWNCQAAVMSSSVSTLVSNINNASTATPHNKNASSTNAAQATLGSGSSQSDFQSITALTDKYAIGLRSAPQSNNLNFSLKDGGIILGAGEGLLCQYRLTSSAGALHILVQWIEE